MQTSLHSQALSTLTAEMMIDEIYQAVDVLQGSDSPVLPTQVWRDATLSEQYDADVWLVSELHQPIGAYKVRGGYNFVANMSDDEKARGLVTPSAGNHAQAIALSAATEGVAATVFMPESTPQQKVDRVRYFGGAAVKVVLAGATVDEAARLAQAESARSDAVFAHPFDDLQVIAGQGSLGVELAQALPDVEVVSMPVGGGGLLAGAGTALKHHNPRISVVGVEPLAAASMQAAFRHGRPVPVQQGFETFVDGAAVQQVGQLPFQLARDLVGQLVMVTNSELRATTTALWERPRPVQAELAGALSVAGLQHIAKDIRSKQVACIVSGGNLSPERYQQEVRLV